MAAYHQPVYSSEHSSTGGGRSSSTMQRQPPVFARRESNSLEEIGDRLVAMLDEIEKRVENLRETAALMEQEKESLVEMLNTVQMNKDMLRLSASEKEDIDATTNRLLTRCRTVEVNVSTPRNYDQERSLKAVNEQIDELLTKLQDDFTSSRQICQRFLNACNPDQPDGPIDQRFQSVLIGCTADDQKKVRRRLEQLSQLIDRADKTVAQASMH